MVNFSPSARRNQSQSGFTLLEVIIVIVVLLFIAVATQSFVRDVFIRRDTLGKEVDFMNGIRFALDIVQRDTQIIYSPQIMLPQGYTPPSIGQQSRTGGSNAFAGNTNNAENAELLSGENAQTTAFWGPVMDKSGIRPSRFVGTEDKMTFVAASHQRVYEDARETEFLKVTYELVRPDAKLTPEEYLIDDKLKSLSMLRRSVSTNAFELDETRDKSTRLYSLLFGIQKLKFRYYQRLKDEWRTSWDTDKEELRNLFPDAIEIALEARGPLNAGFEGVFKIRPEVPNNGLDSRL